MNTYFDSNTKGRDFVVGDLHGCFHMLEDALEQIGFNPETDRLFSVGDLIDRGPQSHLVHKWLDKPWFHAVRGNHEQMLMDTVQGVMESRIYVMNGGGWFMDLSETEKSNYAERLSGLPLSITIDKTNGRKVGIVHADWSEDSWESFLERLGTDEYVENKALWGRSKIHSWDDSEIKGVDLVFVGHTPLKLASLLGNTLFIDTGACFPEGSLTVCSLEGEIVASIPHRGLEKNDG